MIYTPHQGVITCKTNKAARRKRNTCLIVSYLWPAMLSFDNSAEMEKYHRYGISASWIHIMNAFPIIVLQVFFVHIIFRLFA